MDISLNEEILLCLNEVISELKKVKADNENVQYIKSLPDLILLKDNFSYNPCRKSMELIHNWMLECSFQPGSKEFLERNKAVDELITKLRNYYHDLTVDEGKEIIRNIVDEFKAKHRINIIILQKGQKEKGEYSLKISFTESGQSLGFSADDICKCAEQRQFAEDLRRNLTDIIDKIKKV